MTPEAQALLDAACNLRDALVEMQHAYRAASNAGWLGDQAALAISQGQCLVLGAKLIPIVDAYRAQQGTP
jgi:hypothetical protein